MPMITRAGQTTRLGFVPNRATEQVQLGRAKVLGALALLLQFTQADTALAVLIGIPSQQIVTAATALLTAIYIAFNFGTAKRVLLDGLMLQWVLAIFIFPVALIYVHLLIGSLPLYFAYYWTAKYLSIILLFAASFIFSYVCGRRALVALLALSVLMIWGGYFVQMINFDFIRSGLRFRSVVISDLTVQGRAIGFFGHPNKFAISILLYSSLAVFFYFHYRKFAPALTFGFSAGIGVLLAGSRTSLLLFGVLLALTALRFLISSRNMAQLALRYHALLALLALFLLAAWGAASLGNSGGSETLELGLERIGRLFDALNGDGTDASIEIRMETVAWFFAKALETPFVGLGPHATQQAIQLGLQPNVSQNSWVEWMYEFGLPYTGFLLFVFLRTFLSAKRIGNMGKRAKESAEMTGTLLLVMLIATFSINGIFTVEAVSSSLAVVLGTMMRDRWDS